MDLVEIDYNDYLAECTNGIPIEMTDCFGALSKIDLLPAYKGLLCQTGNRMTMTIRDRHFRAGDNLIVLSDCNYDKGPCTTISSVVEGRIMTLAMIARYLLEGGKVLGQIQIYNASKPTIHTRYELELHSVEIIQYVGFKIRGDGWDIDNFKQEIGQANMACNYLENYLRLSVLDKETDAHKRMLLKYYLLEYICEEVGSAIEDFLINRLSTKSLVSNSTGADYSLKNMLSIHNKIMRKAFKNLSEKIISIANSLLLKKAPQSHFAELYSLVDDKNGQPCFKIYSGFIDQLDSLAFAEHKNSIITNKADLVIVHVPVDFRKLKLHINHPSGVVSAEKNEYTYETDGSYFIMQLKRLSEKEVEIQLIKFKIQSIIQTSYTAINVTMDHLIKHAIEEHVSPFIKEAMTFKELQEMAIKPDVDIEYDSEDDLMAEDSGSDW